MCRVFGSWCLSPTRASIQQQAASRHVLECHSAAIRANQWGEKRRPRLVHVMLDSGYTAHGNLCLKTALLNVPVESVSPTPRPLPAGAACTALPGQHPIPGDVSLDCWVPWLSSAGLGHFSSSPCRASSCTAPAHKSDPFPSQKVWVP